jgi:hypothetical protein
MMTPGDPGMAAAVEAEDMVEWQLRQAVMRPSTFAIYSEYLEAQARHAEVMPVRHKRAMFALMRSKLPVEPHCFFPQHGSTVGELATLHVLVPPCLKKVPEGTSREPSTSTAATVSASATATASTSTSVAVPATAVDVTPPAATKPKRKPRPEPTTEEERIKLEEQRERARARDRERQRNRVRVRNRAKQPPKVKPSE